MRSKRTDWENDWWSEFLRQYALKQPETEMDLEGYKHRARQYADLKKREREGIAQRVGDAAEDILAAPKATADEVDRLLRMKHQ